MALGYLINCKSELKLKWIKYCALSASKNDNASDNANNIILLSKIRIITMFL